jgi:dCMP deaminase
MSYLDGEKYETYMKMAYAMAELSPDENTKVGAIMLSPEGRIISSSFNGFLRGAPDDELPADRESTCKHGNGKYTYMQHAERNMIYNCAYEGIQAKGSTIICTLSPCVDCLRACFQAGVDMVIFDKLYSAFSDTDFYKKLPDVHVYVDKDVMSTSYTCLQMITKSENDRLERKQADEAYKHINLMVKG